MKVKVKWNCGDGGERKMGEKKPKQETTVSSIDKAIDIARDKLLRGHRKVVMRVLRC